MSEIRMCDNCGTIFSLNMAGWEEYMRQKKEHHPHSNMPVVVAEIRMHMCPDCSVGEGEPVVKPRINGGGRELPKEPSSAP